jgi:glutamate carboxypeptidase
VNALTKLSDQITQIQNLFDPKTGLKLNWTVTQADFIRNVIPDLATTQADERPRRL